MKNAELCWVDGSSALAPVARPAFVLIDGKAQTRTTAVRPVRNESARKVLAAVAVAVFAISIAGAWAAGDAIRNAQAREAASAIATADYTVRPDDTLWSIAADHAVEGMSTQQMVEWLKAENGLSTSYLQAGQKLVVSADSAA